MLLNVAYGYQCHCMCVPQLGERLFSSSALLRLAPSTCSESIPTESLSCCLSCGAETNPAVDLSYDCSYGSAGGWCGAVSDISLSGGSENFQGPPEERLGFCRTLTHTWLEYVYFSNWDLQPASFHLYNFRFSGQQILESLFLGKSRHFCFLVTIYLQRGARFIKLMKVKDCNWTEYFVVSDECVFTDVLFVL